VAASPTVTLAPLAPISTEDWRRGAAQPVVTLLVYSDFHCAPCAEFAEITGRLEALHPDELEVIFRHYPLIPLHDKAALAAQAAEAAGAQGAFWEMHDALFAELELWGELSPQDFLAYLLELGERMGLEAVLFREALTSGQYAAQMEAAFLDNLAAGVPGAPFVYLNGVWYRLPLNLRTLEASIRLELIRPRQYNEYPPMQIDIEASYLARIETTLGELAIQLYPGYAPLAVNNFVFLAEQGWFDGNPFHRVIRGSLVETGDPSGTGFGTPGYFFQDEIDPALDFDRPGMVAMSSSGPNTNGSQFFITLSPMESLRGTRTIFGRVIRGLELLEDLPERDPAQNLLDPVEIEIIAVHIEVQ
jgi:cyclophilin family peptidyl-prolyl cis-trans isomerase/protein-disulfide isomerase